MSLICSAPISDVTVYRRDYVKKSIPRVQPIKGIRDYDDPLAGPSEEHILPYIKYNKLVKPHKYPDPQEFVDQLCNQYPNVTRYIRDPPAGPPDWDIIDHLYDHDNRSVYMVSYCKLGDFDSKGKQSRKSRPLPDGWVIPETTQRCSYRHPRVMVPGGFIDIKLKPPPENLRPNPRERAMLQTKTGSSEYMGVIGHTGQEIIDGKLHGDINVRPQFDREDLLKAQLIMRD